jgi:hypothetical protein
MRTSMGHPPDDATTSLASWGRRPLVAYARTLGVSTVAGARGTFVSFSCWAGHAWLVPLLLPRGSRVMRVSRGMGITGGTHPDHFTTSGLRGGGWGTRLGPVWGLK